MVLNIIERVLVSLFIFFYYYFFYYNLLNNYGIEIIKSILKINIKSAERFCQVFFLFFI
jgi:hypothetical protein